MPVPYTFGTATSSIPLSQLDSNFATAITIGNTAVQLGNTVTTLNNMTLANVTISSGNVTITNVSVTTANATTANVGTLVVTANATVAGNVSVTGNVTMNVGTITTLNATTANVTTANVTTTNTSSLVVTGNQTFVGTGQRITGDFSNATVANRVLFQTSTTDGATSVGAMPNGTSTTAQFLAYNSSSDPANASLAQIQINSSSFTIRSAISGTGTYQPMTFYTGGSESMRIDTSGNVGIGTTSPSYKLDVLATSNTNSAHFANIANSDTGGYINATGAGEIMVSAGANYNSYSAPNFVMNAKSTSASGMYAADGTIRFWSNSGLTAGTTFNQTERMRIDSSGLVGIGTTSPTALLTLAAGTATANTSPLKFTSGTNLTTPEAGAVEYDGTVMTATTNTNFKRGTIPITNYTSGVGTSLTATSETTLQVLLPSANDTITLSAGTYFVDLACTFTRGTTSTTSATARINILGTGGAAGNFSGMSLSSPTAGGATANFSFSAVNINTSNVVTAASTTASGVYTITLRGILKITTGGTIIPQYNLSANLASAGTATAPSVLYFRLQQMDTQNAAAFGPAGTGWG